MTRHTNLLILFGLLMGAILGATFGHYYLRWETIGASLFPWQSLIAGILAVFAGLFTLAAARYQVSAANTLEQQRVQLDHAGLIGIVEGAMRRMDDAIQGLERGDSSEDKEKQDKRVSDIYKMLEDFNPRKLPAPNLVIPYLDFRENYRKLYVKFRRVKLEASAPRYKLYNSGPAYDFSSIQDLYDLVNNSCTHFTRLLKNRKVLGS